MFACVQSLAGEGPVIVGCTHSLTIHHIVIHKALQDVLHSHRGFRQQGDESAHYTLSCKQSLSDLSNTDLIYGALNYAGSILACDKLRRLEIDLAI